MLQSGKLTLGEPICIAKQGVVGTETVNIFGRKIPLTEVRCRILKRQEKFMRVYTRTQEQTGTFDQ